MTTDARPAGAPLEDEVAPEDIPHASSAQMEAVAALEHELVSDRPVAVSALLAATTLLRIGTVSAGAAVGFYLVDLNTDARVLGLVGSLNSVSEFAFALILARFADRVGRTRFLIGGPLLGAVGALCLALSTDAMQVSGARLVEGIAAAAFVPTALGTIAAATSHSTRARAGASGLFEAANLAGYAIGGLLGGFIYHYSGRAGFAVLAVFYVAAGLVCAKWIPKVPPLPVSPLSVIVKAVTGRGPVRTFLPAWMASFGMIGAFLINLPPLLKVGRRIPLEPDPTQYLTHHFDERIVAGMFTLGLIVLVLGIALWNPIMPKLGAARTMRRAIPGAWLLCAAIMLINHTPLDLAFLYLPLVLLGILVLAGFGPAAVAYLAECSEMFAADRSALMAFYTLTLAAGGFLGGVLGGFASRWMKIDGVAVFGMLLTLTAFIALTRVVGYEKAMMRAVPALEDDGV